MAADGSVVIVARIDGSSADKDLAKLKAKIEKAERDLEKLRSEREQRQEQSVFDGAELDAEKEKLQEIKDRLEDIRAMSKDKTLSLEDRENASALIPSVKQELEDQRTRVRMLQTEYNKLENSIDRYDGKITDATEKLDAMKAEAGQMAQEIEAANARMREMAESATVSNQEIADMVRELSKLKARMAELNAAGVGLGYEEYDQAAARVKEITAALKEYEKGLGAAKEEAGDTFSGLADSASSARMYILAARLALKTLESAFKIVGKVSGTAFDAIKNGAKSAAKAGLELAGALGRKAASGIQNLLFSTKKANSGFADGLKTILRYSFGIRSLFTLFNRMRSAMSEGFQNLAQFSTETNESISSVLSSLEQLKNALATAFQPILTVVAPILTQFISLLINAANTIARLTAMLTGKTVYIRAKKVQQDYAKSLKGTGSAAKEAAQQLAAFDEINTIATEDAKDASGTGAGGVDIADMFEEVPVEPFHFDSWGEAFSTFLDWLLGKIPELKEAFNEFADWLNGLSFNLLEMFTFSGVQDKLKQLGQELADALNQLVNDINWYQLGQALGAGLNSALSLLVPFLYSFDWMNLGRKLAELVNGLVSQVDWYAFGQLLWAKFKIALETLAGFILGLNMPQLAQAASNIVKGFFDSMIDTINKIPWDQVGTQIALFLKSLDWVGMLTSMATAFALAIDAVVTMIYNIVSDPDVWKSIGDGIYAGITAFIDTLSEHQTLQKAVDGLVKTIQGIIDLAIRAMEALTAKPEFWTDLGSAIGKGINDLLTDTERITRFITGFATLATQIMNGIAAALKEINWSDVWSAISTAFSNVDWGALMEAGLNLLTAVLEAKLGLKLTKLNIGFNLIAGLIEGVKSNFQLLLDFLAKSFVGKIIDFICGLFGIASPSKVFAEIGTNLIAGLLEGLSGTWETITGFFSGVFGPFIDMFTGTWGAIKSDTEQKWTETADMLDKTWTGIQQNADTQFTATQQTINGIWDAENVDSETKWAAINQTLDTSWEEMQKNAETDFQAAREEINRQWEAADDEGKKKWEEIGEELDKKWVEIQGSAQTDFDKTRETINGIWDNENLDADQKWKLINQTLSTSWDNSKKNASSSFGEVKNSIVDSFEQAETGIKKPINAILGFIEKLANGVISGVNKVIGALNRIKVDIPDWVPGIGGGRFGFNIPELKPISIPRLAQGAVIPPNQEFMAVLGDQKQGNNIEAPESLIRKIVRDETGETAEILRSIRDLLKEGQVIVVGNDVFGKTAIRCINGVTASAGKSLLKW